MIVKPGDLTDAQVLDFMHVSGAELATRRGEGLSFRNPLHHFTHALAGHETYRALGRRMLTELRPDLAMVYFEAVDSISHLFMKYRDPPLPGIAPEQRAEFVDTMYERQDKVLGELIAAAGSQKLRRISPTFECWAFAELLPSNGRRAT